VRRREVSAELLAQVLDRLARGLERDVGVEQPLDDLQLDEVAVRVQPLRAAAGGVADRRPYEIGPRPVVELPVRDPDDFADHGSAVTVLGLLLRHRPSRTAGLRLPAPPV
jgi:hypothetical protein